MLNAQGVTVKRQLKNLDTARITDHLQIVFNSERRGKSRIVNTKGPDDKMSEIVTVFNHTPQLLLNDELLEN